ncbi:muts domain V-domain-containing protein [Amylocystis lapponica]|nr:muts domain V-domain-containing protein [Amylocystis lapponica]
MKSVDGVASVKQPKNSLATEILDNLAKFPHCILLTRVGQFYESYFDQAQEVAHLLNIKLAERTWDGCRVKMCGFPLMHLNRYLKTLVQHHKRFVAMCEEFPRSPEPGAKEGFNRRVVRIVTPGTLIDEPFLNPYENNYLLALSSTEQPAAEGPAPVGLAWIDVSTGEFFTKHTDVEGLRDELVRISPREVILDQQHMFHEAPIRRAIVEEKCFTSYFALSETTDLDMPTQVSGEDSRGDVVSSLALSHGPHPLSVLSDPEIGAVKLLTAFMRANLLDHMPQLSSPSRETTTGRMQIDAHTIKALEIREGISDGGTTGSLLSVVKRTTTSSGTRLLSRWLSSPSTSISEINARQSLVAFFHSRPYLREDIVQALGDIEDATRIVQKFLLGRGQASDLSAICSTINTWVSVKQRIALEKEMEQRERGFVSEEEWSSLDALMRRMSDLEDLSSRIQNALAHNDDTAFGAIDEDTMADTPSIQSRFTKTTFGDDNWTIKPEFSEELLGLHATLKEFLDRRDNLERRLQSTYASPSLTLRSSPGQGMHVHVGRGKRDSAKLKGSPLFVSISESNSTTTFFFQEWSQLGAQIVDTVASIYAAEREAFETLRNEVNVHANRLRQNARILDELDVTVAFANLASEMKWVRPTLNESMSYHVLNSRHPTVELGLLTAGRVFTPNTLSFTPDSHLHVITGPNMAGKSTLLRQTALLVILAQAGSFVPADSAEVGIVDRVFSRVGAKDDLFRDRSTFMVEMLETSEILRRATPNSLVIMDEVGRGTTVDDGLAVAFAAVHHLLSVNRCRALFATHFHELADMLGYSNDSHKGQGAFANVSFYCTDVDETEDGYFTYSHRLRPGVNQDSHGLKVAQLAGFPQSAVQVAKTTLSWLKDRRASAVSSQNGLQALGQSLGSRR